MKHAWLTTVALFAALLCACGKQTPPPTENSMPTNPSAAITQLQITDLAAGNGDAIAPGQTAVVHYTGWLYDAAAPGHKGTKFDSSRDHGQPFRFPVGAGRVIKGWDQGVAGMQVGGQRRLVVPASLGYGDRGAGGVIPAGATLVFDVELLAIEK
jgi:FKBP-type peptidyl-prolyl cis-trans isomerase FkpA